MESITVSSLPGAQFCDHFLSNPDARKDFTSLFPHTTYPLFFASKLPGFEDDIVFYTSIGNKVVSVLDYDPMTNMLMFLATAYQFQKKGLATILLHHFFLSLGIWGKKQVYVSSFSSEESKKALLPKLACFSKRFGITVLQFDSEESGLLDLAHLWDSVAKDTYSSEPSLGSGSTLLLGAR